MEKIIIPITGMHCKACEIAVEDNLNQVKGVKRVEVSQVMGRAKIWFDTHRLNHGAICSAVENAGYKVGQQSEKNWFSRNTNDYLRLVYAGIILMLLFLLASFFGISEVATKVSQQSIAAAVLVGLVAGVSSCMALIGGLVLALSARHAEVHPEATAMQKFRPYLFFNLGRVMGFALFGGLIGLVGGVLQPSIRTLAIFTIGVGLVMILLGLKLVDVFPVLQRVNITLPKFVSRLLGVKSEQKEYNHRSAFIGGALTFFLPCGFTQVMQLYAISTGSFVQGALIMSLFAIGTAPGLLGVGGLTAAFNGAKARQFFATAGLAVILLGWYNISNASRIVFPSNDTVEYKATSDAQLLESTFRLRSDINPRNFTVKAGLPVKFVVDAKEDGQGCMSTIMIPGLFSKPLFLAGGEKIVMEFTPSKKGDYPITCAMGVKRGVLRVE